MAEKFSFVMYGLFSRVGSIVDVYCSLHRLSPVSQHRVHNLKLMTVPIVLDSLKDALKLRFVNETVLLCVNYVEEVQNLR